MSSVPHSVVHARSYVEEVEKKPTNGDIKKTEPGVKGMVSFVAFSNSVKKHFRTSFHVGEWTELCVSYISLRTLPIRFLRN